jgi:hypothetical protein
MKSQSTFFKDIFVGTVLFLLASLLVWLWACLFSWSLIGDWQLFYNVVCGNFVVSVFLATFIHFNRS